MRPRASAVLLALTALPAAAQLTGHVSLQGQGLLTSGQVPGRASQTAASAVLLESLQLHYTGFLISPAVAVISAGAQFVNVNAWQVAGTPLSARMGVADVSIGLLPRRGVPLRLYARAGLGDGGPQTLAGAATRHLLAFGADTHFDGEGVWPSARLDYEESRFTDAADTSALSNVRRRLTASAQKSIGGHSVAFIGRFDQEARPTLGQWWNLLLALAWSSGQHLTALWAQQLERSFAFDPLPVGARPLTTRDLRASHVQRLGERALVEASARGADERFAAGTGSLATLHAGASARPFATHELWLSGGGDYGYLQTLSDAARLFAHDWGGGLKASYVRSIGPVRASALAGGSSQQCSCGAISGNATRLDVGVGLSSLQGPDLRASYDLGKVWANVTRGGDRFEHHARGSARWRPRPSFELSGSLAYDDSLRDLFDVASSTAVQVHDQAVTAALGAGFQVWRGWGSAEVRYAHGNTLLPGLVFVSGPYVAARDVVSGYFGGAWPLTPRLDLNAQTLASYTLLTDSRPLLSLWATLSLTVRFGRFSSQLAYQLGVYEVSGLSSMQHMLRLSLDRPFEW